jgi:hypothetical protein
MVWEEYFSTLVIARRSINAAIHHAQPSFMDGPVAALLSSRSKQNLLRPLSKVFADAKGVRDDEG